MISPEFLALLFQDGAELGAFDADIWQAKLSRSPAGKRLEAKSPYTLGVGTSRRRLGVILKFVIAAYIAALAALPFAHHDLACHLKSSTHCTVCHVGTSADDTSVQPGLGHVDLADAGRPIEAHTPMAASRALLPSSGRSPPASTNSLL